MKPQLIGSASNGAAGLENTILVARVPKSYAGKRFNADENRWEEAKAIIGNRRMTLGPQASQQWLRDPDHLAMVLARYRAAAALIGNAERVLEIGCGEGIGARILSKDRLYYCGIDTDSDALKQADSEFLRDAPTRVEFLREDIFTFPGVWTEAAVSLDVIEHIPVDREDDFLHRMTQGLRGHGVCVIGTPNAAFDHLASPQSQAGHINTYTHERLHALMSRYFAVVQSFGMQDTSLHLGHPDARHYLLMCGLGVR